MSTSEAGRHSPGWIPPTAGVHSVRGRRRQDPALRRGPLCQSAPHSLARAGYWVTASSSATASR